LACASLLFAFDPGAAGEPAAAQAIEHSRLLQYATPDGSVAPVQTAGDWSIRRQQILKGMELAMGELPDRSKFPPLDVRVGETFDGDGFVRLTISYQSDAATRVPAHLYLPKGLVAGKRAPAMLALHQTAARGKMDVSGEADAPKNRGYAKELAQRGYVVLAPDYPSFGDYPCDFKDGRFASGTMLGVMNHMRGIDLLQAREEVDPDRIGVIGHSLGGHNAMFLGVFDLRPKVIVSSSGWTPFHDYYGGKLDGWTSDRYMPRIRDVYGRDPNRMPFDFYEVAAALAPRAFFSNSPVGDDNFDVRGVRKAEAEARKVFALLNAEDRFQIRYSSGGHDFSDEARRDAYTFIDRALQHTPSRVVP
jgi:acetyl esterase/lipase